MDSFGHVKIEVDIEIDDNDSRSHRCCFYVNSELGLVGQLGNALKELEQATTEYIFEKGDYVIYWLTEVEV